MTAPSNQPLLAYIIDTEQSRLTPGEPGYITVLVAPGFDNQVQCSQIVFAVPYGGANDIFSDEPGVSNEKPATGSWSINSLKKVPTEKTVTITLSSEFHNELVNQTFSFRIEGTVQNFGASSSISFVEHSAVSSDGRPVYTPKDGSLIVQSLAAGAPALGITSFIAQAATPPSTGSPLIPVTEFKRSTPFNLTWSAKGATSYEVYQGSNTTPVYSAGSANSFLVSAGIELTTTFTLIATNQNGETDIRTLTVTVSNPEYADLQVNRNAVLGDSATKDSVTVNASFASNGAANLNAGLWVAGGSLLADTTLDSLSIIGATTAHGNLTAEQTTNLAATNISGAANLTSTLNVTGTSTLGETSVGGNLTVKGMGGKTLTGEGVISDSTLVVNNCFSQDYRTYEVILEDVTPSEKTGAYLKAQLFIEGAWINYNYSVQLYSHDIGGAGVNTYSDESSFVLWPTDRTTPTKMGVFGNLTFYNPAGIGYKSIPNDFLRLSYTGLLFGPYGYRDQGCQIFSSGSHTIFNIGGAPFATGIQFFFSKGIVESGTVRVYGWN